MSEEDKNRKLGIDLNNDVLITNCGVPLGIIVNKADIPFAKFEEKTEFILKHIRKMAINYGATVVYTSSKNNNNITVLYDYLLYILLDYDLSHKSNLNDKNSYFIPSGYDRFSVLKGNDTQNDLDSLYSDVIKIDEKKDDEDEDVLKDEITCEKLSDYLQKIREGKLKSRKSMMRDEIKFGKSLVENEAEKKERQSLTSGVKLEGASKEDKTNKFKEMFEKRGSKMDKNALGVGDKSREEKAKKTKEQLMSKLGLKKK